MGETLNDTGGKSPIRDWLPLFLETILLVREFSVLSRKVSCWGLLSSTGNSAFLLWKPELGCRCVVKAMGGGSN